MRKLLIILTLLTVYFKFFSQINVPQNYFRQPLNGTLLAVGNFCEFRSNHFHAGIDLKAPLNTPVYAAADGYIYRIKIEPSGYGKALYIIHSYADSGFITLYGHLNYFTTEIENWVKKCQYSNKNFYLDTNIDNYLFPVKKGQLIGYVGNKGYSFGPHLHFEIRNLKDEPLNPQLFGFNINDSKAPIINRIAIYANDSESYVNNKDYLIFNVKKQPDNITVHGNIYFGIDADDFLDDVKNSNAIYQTFVFVDNSMIYHSQFNKINYDDNHDVNCMMDYKMKLKYNYNIQRCIVEPNNDLQHYLFVNNNGVFSFCDTNSHEIKFVVTDNYTNTSSYKFTLKSSNLKQNRIIDNQNSKYINCMKAQTIYLDGSKIFLPAKTVYNNCNLIFQVSGQQKFSKIYQIGDVYIPIKNKIILYFDISNIPSSFLEKIVCCKIDAKGNIDTYTGHIADSDYIVESPELGNFYLDVDTIAPKIKILNVKDSSNMSNQSSIKFRITDNLSGIKTFKGSINDNWVLFSYDLKSNSIEYIFDENTIKDTNRLKLEVTDFVNNKSVLEYKFFR